MFKGKISVIGAGFVGSTTAYTLMLSGLASEIVLVDINRDKAEGDAMDMNHGVQFVSPVRITAGDYSETKNSDLVIITAGVGQKPGETRIDLLKRNTSVFRSILDSLLPYCNDNTFLHIDTNPVDILTYATYKISGFPKNRVIGSGTVLDTARLTYLISEHTHVDPRDVHTFIIGEHGDTEVAAWSMTQIAGMSLDSFCTVCKNCVGDKKLCKEDFHDRTKNAAYEIIERKGSTYYAVALAVRRIVEAIIGDENSILTVSSLFEGEYGIDGMCLGIPTFVNSSGVSRILEVPLRDDELADLRRSADTLKALSKEIGV